MERLKKYSKQILKYVVAPVAVVLVVGCVGYNAIKSEAKEINKEYARLEIALLTAGISPKDVIYRGKAHHSGEDDINNDGIQDYHIYLKQPDGTFAPRVVLGVP